MIIKNIALATLVLCNDAVFSFVQTRRGSLWKPSASRLNRPPPTSTRSTTEDNASSASSESSDAQIRAEAEEIYASRTMNARRASEKSKSEIRRDFLEWASASGLVGPQGERASAEVVLIGRETTVPACISQFWRGVARITEKNTNPNTGCWVPPPLEDKRGRTYVMIFPECEELYEWNMMSLVDVTLDFCSGVCVKYGHNFSMTHFHPSYKNSPKLMDVGRHAPFPSFGINIGGPFDEDTEQFKDVAVDQCKTNDEKLKIRHLKAKLTHIYNRPAAGSKHDPMKLNHNERYRTRTFDDERIRQLSDDWIHRMQGEKTEKESETAIRYVLFDDPAESAEGSPDAPAPSRPMRNCKYSVSREIYAEGIYADVWAAVDETYRRGLSEEDAWEAEEAAGRPAADGGGIAQFHNLDWMGTLTRLSSGRRDEGRGDTERAEKYATTLFVTPKFRAFNAEGFKKFAVTVNTSLTRLFQGKMFCEVYHPEYVGKTGYNHEVRRSPFPTLQICYEKGSSLADDVAP